jgi:hypothetical protein
MTSVQFGKGLKIVFFSKAIGTPQDCVGSTARKFKLHLFTSPGCDTSVTCEVSHVSQVLHEQKVNVSNELSIPDATCVRCMAADISNE